MVKEGCGQMSRTIGERVAGRLLAVVLMLVTLMLVGCNREPAAWSTAQKLNTVQAYESYLGKHGTGPHAAEAKGLMVEVQEWDKARAAPGIESLESFLQKYPGTRMRSEAERLLAPLTEARDWEKACAGASVESLEGFLTKYPQSSRADEANRQLVETRAWSEARKSRSVAGIEAFLKEYPATAHGPEASKLARALQWQQILATKGTSDDALEFHCTSGMLRNDGNGNYHRNGATVAVNGHMVITNQRGESIRIRPVGMIWSKSELIYSSYFYSYDSEIGETDLSRFAGLTADPAIDRKRPVSVFRMNPGGRLTFEP